MNKGWFEFVICVLLVVVITITIVTVKSNREIKRAYMSSNGTITLDEPLNLD